MHNAIPDLLKIDLKNLKFLKIMPGANGTFQYINQQTNTMYYVKKFDVSEIVMGMLYQILLEDQAPEIGIAFDSSQNSDTLYTVLKSMENDLPNLAHKYKIYTLGKMQKSFLYAPVLGLEKIAAASVILRECDNAQGNIVVSRTLDENSDPIRLACKVDHGLSCDSFLYYNNKIEFKYIIAYIFRNFVEHICYKNCKLNLMKFTTALIEANALYQKFYENDDATLNSIFEMLRPYHSASYDINQEIEQVRYKLKSEHSEFVEKLIEELLVIQKFDVHPSFYNTKWLECYTEPISADLIHPLFIAIKNKFTIEGADPIQWYQEHKPEELAQLLDDFHQYKKNCDDEYEEMQNNEELKINLFYDDCLTSYATRIEEYKVIELALS